MDMNAFNSEHKEGSKLKNVKTFPKTERQPTGKPLPVLSLANRRN